MRLLYLDCGMGAAGDMLAAALYELCPDREGFLRDINSAGIPGVEISVAPSVKNGVTGTHFSVRVHGQEEREPEAGETCPHEHTDGEHHGHTHEEHPHHHSHAGSMDIDAVIDSLRVDDRVREHLRSVYGLIARAESKVHGCPVEQVHFHEVGAMDAVADVLAVAMLVDRIAPDRIVASPVHVGSGTVRCAHGVLPVPAPATAELLRGIPIYGGSIKGELCTPTGAALLKHFADEFGPMPMLRPDAIGSGMGTKNFETANCLRAILGDAGESAAQAAELVCNLDDMTGEAVGFAMERLFEAGALDVYTVPIGMKKSRPGVQLRCMCAPGDVSRLRDVMLAHTTTLGIRVERFERFVLPRRVETRETEYGPVRVKIATFNGAERRKAEYEDIAGIAARRGVTLDEARRLAD